MKVKKILKYICVVVIAVIIFLSGFFTHYITQDKDLRSLEFILKYYKNYYYDVNDQNGNNNEVYLMSEAILDQYSEYYSKEDFAIIQSSARGERIGIGISSDLNLNILSVVGNSPSEDAGVKDCGRVIGVKYLEDENFIDLNKEVKPSNPYENYINYSNFLNGVDIGETINLKVLYRLEDQVFTITKKHYTETFVKYADSQKSYYFTDKSGKMEMKEFALLDLTLPTDTAYLKLSSFNGRGTGGVLWQFNECMQKFAKDGKRNLIIDLRNNGGGYLDILINLSNYFIPKKENAKNYLITQAVYKNGKKENYYSTLASAQDFNYKKIIILVNENSASASEAFVGALLDYNQSSGVDVSVLISSSKNSYGETVYKSYGKGIMQSTFNNFFTGEAIKLTTAYIYWPLSRKCIHGVGITKDTDARCFEVQKENALYEAILKCSN